MEWTEAGWHTACVLVVCAAEILSLAGYSIIVAALLPQITSAWSLDRTQGGWLAGINAGSYMLGSSLWSPRPIRCRGAPKAGVWTATAPRMVDEN